MKSTDLDIILEKFRQEIYESTKGNKSNFSERVIYNKATEILENIIEQQKLDNEIQRLKQEKSLKETKEEW